MRTEGYHGKAGRYVVIGTTVVAKRVCDSLTGLGHDVVHLSDPAEDELRAATSNPISAVAVLVHDDVACLRYALTVAHMLPRTRLVVSLFDRTVADQLRRVMPECVIASPADVAAPSLAAACLDSGLLALWSTASGSRAIRQAEDGHAVTPHSLSPRMRWRSRLGRIRGQLRPHDNGSRMLLVGLTGITSLLSADWLWLYCGHHRDAAGAFYEAARVVATVGPAEDPGASAAYRMFAAFSMLATIIFTGVFTAGVVHRAMNGRPFGLVGYRTPPVDGHVVVVGLGQVGLRLCIALKRLGVNVVAVERDPAADNLRIAKLSRIPVLVAHGSDRQVLRRLRLRRATAIAAVGSDELGNIAVAVAALAVAPGVRVVLRAGESEAIAETRSLFQIAEIRDVTAISATYVLLALQGSEPEHLCSDGVHVYARLDGGVFADCTPHGAPACGHTSQR
ncbi:NAD-binding protein [Longispora albida]|uniref:NAD-binding protein n=1 Tax=Longispora albida TaxID=203523 RepID=UPI00037591C4|nr:NAD-binding protein [Longispora albida]